MNRSFTGARSLCVAGFCLAFALAWGPAPLQAQGVSPPSTLRLFPQGERSLLPSEISGDPSTVPPTAATNLQISQESYFFELTPHEYGPPGYVRRPHDTGPEMPVLVPESSASLASSTAVTHGSGANKALLQWGGRVHLDVPIDFDPIGSTGEFVTATIPIPQEQGGNANFSARASRLQLKTQLDSHAGPVTGFVQLDFFDNDTQGSSYGPRLRFLYFDVGYFRFGQDATLFMDYSASPNIIENEGPASMVLIRQSLARVTIPLSSSWKLALGAEQPFSDITFSQSPSGASIGGRLQEIPDFTGHLRFDGIYAHLQCSGIVRRLTYETPLEAQRSATGYGINLTGDLQLWSLVSGGSPVPDACPRPVDKCRFVGQYATGYGIARYIQDASGMGLDAALDGNGELVALFARGWYAGYEHWWSNELTSTFLFAQNANGSTATLPAVTYIGADYLAANLIWNYSDNGWVGIECLWGQRHDLNGQSADANRIQLGFRHTF